MNISQVLSVCQRWHFRALGIFWALCGLALVSDLVWGPYWWAQVNPWITVVVGIPYVVVGIGFAFGRVWARWWVLPLMFVAGLVCLDGFLNGGLNNDRTLFWQSTAGLGLVCYTGAFTMISLCKFCHDYV